MKKAGWSIFATAATVTTLLVLSPLTAPTSHSLGIVSVKPGPETRRMPIVGVASLEDNTGRSLGDVDVYPNQDVVPPTMPEQIGTDGRVFIIKRLAPPGVLRADYREIHQSLYSAVPPSITRKTQEWNGVITIREPRWVTPNTRQK